MSLLKHVGFEVPAWRELGQGPQVQPDYRDQIMAMNPVAYWRLGETSGVFQDQVLAYPSVSIGSGITRGVAGAVAYDDDQAVRFPGVQSTGYISFGNVLGPVFANTNPFTILVWFRQISRPINITQVIFYRKPVSGSQRSGIALAIAPPNANDALFANRVALNGSTTVVANAPTTNPTPSVWHQAAMVFDGSWLTVYQDGVPGSAAAGGSISIGGSNYESQNDYLGGRPDAPIPFFGDLDEAAVFARALTVSELTQTFHTGVGR
jgi:signal peptidase